MAERQYKKIKIPKPVQLLLKIAVAVVCLWYVSGKIDFKKAGMALQKADWFYLPVAVMAFILSKLVASVRLNIYFRNIGIRLSQWQNIRLYWLGMFYNLFLPGSISGDAYKVILLTRKLNAPPKKTTAAVLLDRFSGLLGLGLILAFYGLFALHNKLQVILLIAGALSAVAGLYIIIKIWFRDFLQSFYPTLFLGMIVQSLQVICIYLIMAALGIRADHTAYIFIFLASSVVAVLPLTIGGIGIREVVFLEGSAYFELARETSVVISILFFLITLFTSAPGLYYVFKDPLIIKKKRGPSLSP